MNKGDIVLNKYAGENNPCRISIITYIGKVHINVLYEQKGALKKAQYFTRDLKTDKEHFVIIGHLDYEKVIREKLRELKRGADNGND